MPIDWYHDIMLLLLKPNREASITESYRFRSLGEPVPTVTKEEVDANRLWYDTASLWSHQLMGGGEGSYLEWFVVLYIAHD